MLAVWPSRPCFDIIPLACCCFQILFENTKHALMDTCLALALFRAEVSPSVLAMFGGLLFCKVFHWLSKSRLEHVSRLLLGVDLREEISRT